MTRPIDKKVLKIFGREQAYWTAVIALTFFHAGLIMMGYAAAFIPIERARYVIVEGVITVVCIVSLMGMYLHVLDKGVQYTRWSYLLACFATSLALSVFLIGNTRVFNWQGETVVILLLLSGLFVAMSMHIEHGGRSYTIKKKE